MTILELKAKIIEVLKGRSVLSTRSIANKILTEVLPGGKYKTQPGDSDMARVRYALHRLKKEGLVMHPNSNYWTFNKTFFDDAKETTTT